jgi:L-aspartate oxidase
MNATDHLCDILVLGSGAAGLAFALDLPASLAVTVLSKGRLDQGATNRAQGGIAAVLGEDDSIEAHVRDTLEAGAGLCDERVVRFAVERGPEAVRWLIGLGIELTWETGAAGKRPHLTREGGHSRRRVAHAEDATGRAVQACLENEAARRPNVRLIENRLAIDLIARLDDAGRPRCVGAYALNGDTGRVETLRARAVMMATGGASGVYRHCTNPAAGAGDGIAMAWRAGCRVANMEFTQFHPTSLFLRDGEPLLISEAVRGEGGVLRRPGGAGRQDNKPGAEFAAGSSGFGACAPGGAGRQDNKPGAEFAAGSSGFGACAPGGAGRQDNKPGAEFAAGSSGFGACAPGGERFMDRFDARAELAPRDIVARAIDHEMKRLGIAYVHLDISHRPAEFVREHFPMLYRRCLEVGIDMTAGPIPVVPAAHYTCGGIVADLAARTDLAGLYAAGECAATGLHGANRLASNSLLECIVFARAAAADVAGALPALPPPALPPWDESQVRDSDEEVVLSHNRDEIRRFMWDYVGIVRTGKRLKRALSRVELLKREVEEYYARFRVTPALIELRNMVMTAELIVRSALARKESRGLHYILDYPRPDASRPPADTILAPPPRHIIATGSTLSESTG